MHGEYVCTLSDELQEKARRELGEDPVQRAKDIQTIRRWIQQADYLNAKADDASILQFLRCCKFSLEKTKERIDLFYTMKAMVPEFHENYNPFLPAIQKLLTAGVFLPLPGHDPEGRKVILIRVGQMDIKQTLLEDMIKYSHIIIDILLHQDESLQINGLVLMEDSSGFTAGHITWVNPVLLKKAFVGAQDCYPLRLKAFHYINEPKIFASFINMVKRLMKEKLRNRLHFHGDNLESLHAHIPQKMLPKEYGGTAVDLTTLTEYWKKEVESNAEFLKDSEAHKADETKRPGKPRTHLEIFGMEGSFKQLEFD